jgi:hypothetical protein
VYWFVFVLQVDPADGQAVLLPELTAVCQSLRAAGLKDEVLQLQDSLEQLEKGALEMQRLRQRKQQLQPVPLQLEQLQQEVSLLHQQSEAQQQLQVSC